MHQNVFGGRAPPGPAGGAYSAPPGWIKWEGKQRRGVGTGKEKGRGKKGQDPQMSEVR